MRALAARLSHRGFARARSQTYDRRDGRHLVTKASMLAVGVFFALASCHDGQPRADDAGADAATPGDFAITTGTDGGPGCPGSQPQGGCSSANLSCDYGSPKGVCGAPQAMGAGCSP